MSDSHPRNELLQTYLNAFTRALPKIERGDVRAIHRTRVASRRLRELMPVLQVDADRSRPVLRDLRRATRELGRLRELDVLVGLLEALRVEAAAPRAGAIAGVLDHLRGLRKRVQARAVDRGLHRRLSRLARRVEKIAHSIEREDGRVGAQPWRWAAQARVVRRARRAKAAIEDAGAVYLPDRLHEVRKGLKKLRYAVELLRQVDPTAVPATDLNRLKRSQELLGDLHDRQTIIDRIRELQAIQDAPQTRRDESELDMLLSDLEVECRRLHARYLRGHEEMLMLCSRAAAPPRAVTRRRSSGKRSSDKVAAAG
jgi:CHAD domain-containing protein